MALRTMTAGISRTGRAQRAKAARTMQRTIGNVRAARFASLQRKVEVGPANDPAEREADHVAQRIVSGQDAGPIARAGEPETQSMRVGDEQAARAPATGEETEAPAQTARRSGDEKPAQPLRRTEEDTAQAARRQSEESDVATLRRQEDDAQRTEKETAQPARRQGGESDVATLRRQEDGGGGAEEKAWPEPAEGEVESLEESGAQDTDLESAPEAAQLLRRKSMGPEGGAIEDPALAARIDSPSGGRALPDSVRATMEPKFNRDLSGVKVHDSPQDQSDVKAINARAMAHRNHIWLGKGESVTDKKIMAHEITHTDQQGALPKRKGAARVNRHPQRVQRGFFDWVREKAAGLAARIPGYNLLTVAIGYDPIAGHSVERSATNIVRGVLTLIPVVGETLYKQLKSSGAIERAATWFNERIATLNITLGGIKALFKRAWDSISIWDGIGGAWQKIKNIFGPFLGRLLSFAKSVGKKVLEFIFEGAMAIAGPLGTKVMGVIRKAGDTIGLIFANPVGFLKNLLGAVMKGFGQFSTNILTHLKTGLMGWLFGTLGDAGLQMPEKFDLKGILSIVMQVLGISYARIRPKLVKVVGEKRVAFIEKAVEFVKILVTEGIAGVWKKMVEYIGNLKDMVIGAIQSFVVTKIITAAITKIASMFNPVGAIIQAVITVYNVVMWLIQRIKQIAAVVSSITDSIAAIAQGKIGAAANYVEQTMARTLPVIISFLAGLMGLGGVAGKIKGVIKKIQAKVDKAIDKVIGFVVKKAKALFAKVKGAAKGAVAKGKAAIAWWKSRKSFTSRKGDTHSVYFKGEGLNAKPVLASDELEIGTWLESRKKKLQKKKKFKGAVKAAYTRIKTVLLPELQQLTYPDSAAASSTASSSAGAAVRPVDVVQADLIANIQIIGVLDEPPIPRLSVNPGFSSAKANGKMSVRYLFNDSENHAQGTGTSGKEDLHGAFTEIKSLGQSIYWHRSHLVNSEWGGLAVESNLVPLPAAENTGDYKRFDREVRDLYWADPGRVIWMGFTVLRSHADDPQRKFVSNLKAEAGPMQATDSEWTVGATDAVTPYSKDIPRPVAAVQATASINSLRGKKSSRKRKREVAKANGISATLMKALADENQNTRGIANEAELFAFIDTRPGYSKQRKSKYRKRVKDSSSILYEDSSDSDS